MATEATKNKLLPEMQNVRDSGSLEARGLSTGIPKPNIVRIETLDGNARQRYLGGLQAFGDKLRSNIYDSLTERNDRVFFGFLRNAGNQSFGFSNTWNSAPGGGNLLGGIKALANKVAPAATAVAEGIADVAKNLTSTSAVTTGSASLKKYSGVALNDFDVECGWYLPEQFNLCSRSLQILTRMGYPVQLNEKRFAEELPKIVQKIADDLQSNPADQATNDKVASQNSGNTLLSLLIQGGQLSIKGISSFNKLFGRNLTFDPLPVRVSVGQYIDIEPMVIKGVRLEFSKETFINSAGRHVPIFCTAKISLEFWLTPAPRLQFAKVLDTEMFGQDNNAQVTRAEQVKKVADNKTPAGPGSK